MNFQMLMLPVISEADFSSPSKEIRCYLTTMEVIAQNGQMQQNALLHSINEADIPKAYTICFDIIENATALLNTFNKAISERSHYYSEEDKKVLDAFRALERAFLLTKIGAIESFLLALGKG
jgi:hypothetical protein